MLLRTACLTALVLFGAQQAHALTFYEQDYVCPIGGEKFKTKVVGSETRVGQRLDMRPVGALIAPHPLPVCPNGFVMYKEKLSQEEVIKLTPILLSPEYQAARKVHTPHYLAAIFMEHEKFPPYSLGFAYLRAAWEAERDPSPDRWNDYRQRALAKFEAHLQETKERDQRWWTAAILAAELERQLGQFDEAVKRVDALPVAELPVNSAGQLMVDQIRQHAMAKNVKPERLVAVQKN